MVQCLFVCIFRQDPQEFDHKVVDEIIDFHWFEFDQKYSNAKGQADQIEVYHEGKSFQVVLQYLTA